MKFLERFWHGCGHCDGEESCPMIRSAHALYDANPWFRGPRMVLTAVSIFLVPLLAGIVGAYLAQTWWASDAEGSIALWQTVGLLGGVAIGLGLAKLLVIAARLTRFVRPSGDSACSQR